MLTMTSWRFTTYWLVLHMHYLLAHRSRTYRTRGMPGNRQKASSGGINLKLWRQQGDTLLFRCLRLQAMDRERHRRILQRQDVCGEQGCHNHRKFGEKHRARLLQVCREEDRVGVQQYPHQQEAITETSQAAEWEVRMHAVLCIAFHFFF